MKPRAWRPDWRYACALRERASVPIDPVRAERTMPEPMPREPMQRRMRPILLGLLAAIGVLAAILVLGRLVWAMPATQASAAMANGRDMQ